MLTGRQLAFAGKRSMLVRDPEAADDGRGTLAHERLTLDHKRSAFVRGRSMSGCRRSIADFDCRMDAERSSDRFALSLPSTYLLSADRVSEQGNFCRL
jgi:hypothetical protein